MKALVLAVLALTTQSPGPALVQQADPVGALRKAARSAEVRYEQLVRRLAPFRLGGFGAGCDEIVGRYCVRYESPGEPTPPTGPEPAELTDARRAAIEALRGVFTYQPDEFETAGPLVRYLVEDGRASEALPAARLFRAVSGDSVWGPLLEGFALHATGETIGAERAYTEALTRMSPVDRRRFENLEWILDGDDRSAYRRMDSGERERFERWFWTVSDPLYLTPGNEARSEHLSRHVWSRILERAPVVAGAQTWGSDLEQLTVRFGTPHHRTRLSGRVGLDNAVVDHFDPRQLAYTPQSLIGTGLPPTPLPDAPWELERTRTRAGHVASGVTAVRFLPHQVSRFPDPDGATIRFDAAYGDSLPDTRGDVETAVRVFNGLGDTAAEFGEVFVQQTDTLGFSFEASVPDGHWVYSLEALDRGDSAAARARYSIEVEPASEGPRISDPVLIEPFRGRPPPDNRRAPGFRPCANLTFTTSDTLGVYVEVAGLRPGAPARLRLSLQPASRANLPARVLGWIGRRIGLAESRDPVFVEWTASADADGRLVLAFELPPQGVGEGNHVLIAHLTDLAAGGSAESQRVLRYVQDR